MSFLFPIVYTALDFGTHKSREFFEKQEHPEFRDINRYLAPNLVRFFAIQNLKLNRNDLFTLENVPNNGIYLWNDRYNIRVLKSNLERLPVPGHSISRQQYYHQQGILDLFENDGNGSAYKWNLLLLWNVKSEYQLGNLSLACPQAGGRTRESVLSHWHRQIPDTYIFGGFDIDISESPEVNDLPLELNIDESEIEDVK
jgi:hypothetical protein